MTAENFEDILYQVDGPAAIVTINRPHRYNAFRGQTVEEMVKAFRSGGKTLLQEVTVRVAITSVEGL